MIYLTMVFGWAGAPGERAARGRGVQDVHRARRKPRPELRDAGSYASEASVDDGVLVEPLLGARPRYSAAAFDAASRLGLGEESINVAKPAVEGEFTTEKLIWGQLEDADGNFVDRVTLPAAKIQKMGYLLQDPVGTGRAGGAPEDGAEAERAGNAFRGHQPRAEDGARGG